MIDVLFITYPNMSNILGEIVPGTLSSNDRHYVNVLSGNGSSPQIPKNAQQAENLGDWINHLNPSNGKLLLSTCVQDSRKNGKGANWVKSTALEGCIQQLMKFSRQLVFVTTTEEDFIHDQMKQSNVGMELFDELAQAYENLHALFTKLQNFSSGNYLKAIGGRLHSQSEINKINCYANHIFVPLPSRSRKNRAQWKAITHGTNCRESAIPPISDLEKEVSMDFGSCQVLTVLGSVLASWTQFRGITINQMLADHVISHNWTHYTSDTALSSQIESSGCSVVINETWTIPHHIINRLAILFPAVRFINMIHSSPSFMPPLGDPRSLTVRMEMLEHYDHLATVHPNVYNGTVMEANRFELNGSKVISIPNPIRTANFCLPRKPDPNLLSLSLISRFCPLKNLGGQIAAIRKVAKTRPVSLLLMTTHNRGMGRFVRGLREAGVSTTVLQWGTWENCMHLISLYVDVGLQVSLSESLNMVALEHMMLGKPVVGSQSIEYLPEHWQANPQNPNDIANIIMEHADNLEGRSLEAKNIAQSIKKKNNQTFVKSIKSLLER